ncbi:MAG: hypothetical protein K2Y28_08740 [Burkholderiaceae bacterium]|nr:hypothetical protein [Burkholderiaceae bacterium]
MNLFLFAHEFINCHQREIFNIARRHNDFFDDVCQDAYVLILEIGDQYDSRKGSFECYIFGHLNQLVRRKNFGPTRFAISIDADSEASKVAEKELTRISLENFTEATNGQERVAGHATLDSVANAISARSSIELARSLKLTKRRINQILAKIKNDAASQFGLDFDGDNDD